MATRTRHVKAIIQFRRGTEAEWIAKNPILRDGEPALSRDVDLVKVGDGKRHWLDLPYLSGGEAANYLALYNLPSINEVTLKGDKSGSDLGLQDEMDALEEADIDRILFGGI